MDAVKGHHRFNFGRTSDCSRAGVRGYLTIAISEAPLYMTCVRKICIHLCSIPCHDKRAWLRRIKAFERVHANSNALDFVTRRLIG